MWEWNEGEVVYNFGAEFVAPAYDQELVRLIRERDDAPYNGSDDYERIKRIMERVRAIGGEHLVWS